MPWSITSSPARAEEEIGLHLHNWLEAHVLRREAEAIISSKDPGSGSDSPGGGAPPSGGAPSNPHHSLEKHARF